MSATRIEDGVEWYTYERDGETEEECQCARCGSSACWDECDLCGGVGATDDSDDCDYCMGDACDACCEPCHWCDEDGGWWRCISSREWCEANPLPGREHIDSTALNPETL